MGFDYFVFYTEASFVCVAILLMILITDRMYSNMQEKQIWFMRAVTLFIMYFISDAFWAAILSGQFPKIRALVFLFNYTNFILLALMVYGLFMFMAASEKMEFRNDPIKRRLCLVPVLISIVFITVAFLVNPLFWINENNELNRLYYIFMFTVPIFYLFAGLGFSVKYAIRAQSRAERQQCILLGSIPLVVMAFGMIQVVFLNAPTFCFGCTLMWLWYYIQNMETMISVDDLTHLNNRGQINRFMEQLHYIEGNHIYILMIDINRFKKINDTYGHAEGDRALILVSDALRKVCEQIKAPVFLGRYGGDEFTIIIRNPDEGDLPKHIADRLRGVLSDMRRERKLPYELLISIGYDEVTDDNDTIYACLERADKMLYIDKKRVASM